MTNGTTDAFTVLADELGRIGRRLDGMGTELLALRAGAEPVTEQPAEPPADHRPIGEAAPGLPGGAPGATSSASATPPFGVPTPGPAVTSVTGPGAAGAPPPARSPWAMPPGTAPYPPPPYGAAPQRPGGYPAPPGGPNWAPAGGYPHPGPSGWTGAPVQPAGLRLPPPAPQPPTHQPPAPRRSSALTSARLLAWTGGAVTLLGIVLLLALAASRGWLTPPFGLATAGVLGALLVGLALRLHRKESARTGAFALAATGFAALYLTVAAATSLYDYLVPAIAIPLALIIAAAGLGIADRWRSALLAGGVTVGGALLAPALAHTWLLVALALALQLAALPVVMRRGWPVLLILAAAGPALYGAGVLVDESRLVVVVLLAIAALAVGLASAFLARTAAGARATVVVAAALPALAGAAGLEEARGWILALGVAVVLGALTFLPEPPNAVRVAAGVTAVVALLEATLLGFEGTSWVTVAVLGEALAAAGVATVLRSRFAVVVGLALGSWGFLAAISREAPLRALVRFDTFPYLLDGTAQIGGLVTGIVVSLLILAVATVLLLATGRLGWTRPDSTSAGLWVPMGLVGLFGAASLVMAVAMLVAPTQAGFTAGHAVITVSWAVAALVLLAQGLRRPALRIAGLVLVAAAVAKLFLFDLVALDGVARVVAFLVTGLVLLAAGTRYARLVAEAEGVTPEKEQSLRSEHQPEQVPPTG